jgi:outer membrane murein-binding lipoprotein Lpp
MPARNVLLALVAILGGSALIAGVVHLVRGDGASSDVAELSSEPDVLPGETPEAAAERHAREHAEMLDRDWPRHGRVTRTQLTVRMEPNPESLVMGWLRIGAHIRTRGEPAPGPDCASGWVEIHPRGYVCTGSGLEVSDTPPSAPVAVLDDEAEEGDVPAPVSDMAPDLTSALPYHYYFVKEPQVPEYYQLPSREDQRNAAAHAARYLELLNAGDTRRAERLRAGELPGEPAAPREVARFLDHGFFVASNGIEIRSRRRFVRTVRGMYIKESQLEERTGHSFAGVELGPQPDGTELHLPIAYAIRAARPMIAETRADGTLRMIDDPDHEAIERLSRVTWLRRERVGDQSYHVVALPTGEERYLREWFLALAEVTDTPSGIEPGEPWVHVDLSSQTLVLYRGETPVYATLVSSGVEGHETAEGEFTIRRKFVSDTMADPGSDLGNDRYRIEDVPWTQYFDGSIALHAAFWHAQYGIVHSHGCVNLSPNDARYVYGHTWPEIPEGWHGVSTEGTGFRGSRVIVTR